MSTVPAETHIGTVALTVSDMGRALRFYQEHLGFRLHRREGDEAFLGTGEDDLLRLREQPGAQHVRRASGLYHFAILMPDRLALARILRHFANQQTPMQGFSDHLVSEALYLADPDGNGIEVYRDRPRSEWPSRDGQLTMATDPLDLQDILNELAPDEPVNEGRWDGLPQGTTIGHIHLHVSNIERDEAFYRDVIGFDLVTRYPPAASFLSAGGYHHHLGINVWAGVGVPPPPAGSVGLRWYSIEPPSQDDVNAIAERAAQNDVATEAHDEGIFLRDPAGNGIILRAAQ